MTETPPFLDLALLNQVPLTCVGMHVRRASRVVTQIYDAALRPLGLVLNQFTLLAAISLLQSAPITHLAQALYTDQTTLTRNLKLLHQRGLVAIEPGTDRRVRLVSLTAEGQALLAQALPRWQQAQDEVLRQFGAEKGQVLLALLTDLANLE